VLVVTFFVLFGLAIGLTIGDYWSPNATKRSKEVFDQQRRQFIHLEIKFQRILKDRNELDLKVDLIQTGLRFLRKRNDKLIKAMKQIASGKLKQKQNVSIAKEALK
jgi:hypothetical protein